MLRDAESLPELLLQQRYLGVDFLELVLGILLHPGRSSLLHEALADRDFDRLTLICGNCKLFAGCDRIVEILKLLSLLLYLGPGNPLSLGGPFSLDLGTMV